MPGDTRAPSATRKKIETRRLAAAGGIARRAAPWYRLRRTTGRRAVTSSLYRIPGAAHGRTVRDRGDERHARRDRRDSPDGSPDRGGGPFGRPVEGQLPDRPVPRRGRV